MPGTKVRGAAPRVVAPAEPARPGRPQRRDLTPLTVSSAVRRLVAVAEPEHHPGQRPRRVAVVTDEATLGEHALETLRQSAARMPDLRQQTEMRIRHFAVPAASVRDFVDLTHECSTRSLATAVDALADDPGCDAVLVALGATDREFARSLVRVVERVTRDHPDTPVAVVCPAAQTERGGVEPDPARRRPSKRS